MKSKKILLGSLSAMALVATPIAAVVSCDDNKGNEDASTQDNKISKEASITKSKATGFVVRFGGELFVTAEQAKAGGSVIIMLEGKPATLTWDKKLEVGTKVSFKTIVNGKEIKTPSGKEFTPKQADDQHFVLRAKGATIGEYVSLDNLKSSFGGFVALYDGKPTNGVKLLFDKTTNVVTAEGIKIFNDLLKETGLVVASATVTIHGTPAQTNVSITWDTTKGKANAATDAAAFKADSRGFVIDGRMYIPEYLASNAGKLKLGASTFSWTSPLSRGATVRVVDPSGSHDVKAMHAEETKFVVPLKGQNGVGLYGDVQSLKQAIPGILELINLKLITKGGSNTEVTKESLLKFNAFFQQLHLQAAQIHLVTTGSTNTFNITWR